MFSFSEAVLSNFILESYLNNPNQSMIMKKGMLLIILLFCVSFVVAQPPSFHVFSGYVSCEEFDGHLTDYSISATIYGDNISSSFQGEINGGEYVIFVDDSKFNCSEECGVNFVVSGENFVGTNYSSMGFDIFNITLSAEHSLCSSGTVCEDGTCEGDETCSSCPADCGTCPTTGGGPTGGSTSDDECGDDEVNQDDEECDGIDLEDKTCAIVGFDSGDLSCYDNCTFDSSACVGTGPECGNGLKSMERHVILRI